MKSTYAVIALTTAAAFWLATGCGKKEEAPPTAQEMQKAVQQAAGEAQKAVEQQAPAVKQATEQAAASAQQTTTTSTQQAATTVQQAAASIQQAAASAVQQAAGTATPQQAGAEAQSLIDKAKGLMADKKWMEALGTLKDAAGKQPTPEQKGLLDQLIAEVQKALAGDAGTQLKSEATKALGGLLGK